MIKNYLTNYKIRIEYEDNQEDYENFKPSLDAREEGIITITPLCIYLGDGYKARKLIDLKQLINSIQDANDNLELKITDGSWVTLENNSQETPNGFIHLSDINELDENKKNELKEKYLGIYPEYLGLKDLTQKIYDLQKQISALKDEINELKESQESDMK